MVVVEGVARCLDPKLDMWATAEPVVRTWIEGNLGPIGRLDDARRAGLSLAKFAAALPSTLLRAENIAIHLERSAESGFELSEEAVKKIMTAHSRALRLGHLALWLIALSLIGYFIFQ
jgi:ubiquinone biosynthesis protein